MGFLDHLLGAPARADNQMRNSSFHDRLLCCCRPPHALEFVVQPLLNRGPVCWKPAGHDQQPSLQKNNQKHTLSESLLVRFATATPHLTLNEETPTSVLAQCFRKSTQVLVPTHSLLLTPLVRAGLAGGC